VFAHCRTEAQATQRSSAAICSAKDGTVGAYSKFQWQRLLSLSQFMTVAAPSCLAKWFSNCLRDSSLTQIAFRIVEIAGAILGSVYSSKWKVTHAAK
jgi:hypothetical protein